jgi:hypothetical protein
MSLPGGIRTTLAVALLLIVGGALGGAYLMVVPSLERRLVAERLDELQSDAEATAYSYTRADARGDFNDPLAVDTFVDAASLLVNARVVVYQVFGPEPLSLRTLADSAATAGQISDAQLASVARFVLSTRSPDDRGGAGIGHVGPIPEGLVVWLVGMVAVLGAARLLGERT